MISRFEASKILTSKVDDNTLIVASLGNTKYDLFNAKDRPRNFYLWNSMGMASSFGLGLAMARPDLRVVILQGDGGVLMNMGSLATTAYRGPKNLLHICWDNHMWEITGRQPTATAGPADLGAIAAGAGYAHVDKAETLAAFEQALDRALAGEGPWFIHALVDDQKGVKPRPPRSPTWIKHRFMDAVGVAPMSGGTGAG